jgi:hypothetical protein
MGRLRWSMIHLAPIARLNGYIPLVFEYKTRKGGINYHAECLVKFLEQNIKEPNSSVGFICHSLGGVILQVASNLESWKFNQSYAVLLGTPNNGAKIASIASKIPFVPRYFGQPLSELINWKPVRAKNLQIGVIAGVLSKTKSLNPFLPEPNDTLVMVSETLLDGIKEHRIIHCPHAVMMYHPMIIKYAFEFLKSGTFTRNVNNNLTHE